MVWVGGSVCGGVVCALRITCRSNDDEIQLCNIYVDFLHLGARNLNYLVTPMIAVF